MINEDSTGESLPLTHGEGETFTAEIRDKYEDEVKEQLKSNVSERAPAGEADEEAEAAGALQHEIYGPSLWDEMYPVLENCWQREMEMFNGYERLFNSFFSGFL